MLWAQEMIWNSCVRTFDHEFVGKTEHNNNITKFLAKQRTSLRAGEPEKKDNNVKCGAFSWTF
jgi:hypothetical protein